MNARERQGIMDRGVWITGKSCVSDLPSFNQQSLCMLKVGFRVGNAIVPAKPGRASSLMQDSCPTAASSSQQDLLCAC